jgi:hypothetical protein
LDKVFKVNRGKCPFSRKGEKVKEISIVTAIFISLNMFEKEWGLLKTFCDFKMVVAQILIVRDVFWSDPRRLEKLHRIRQLSIKAEISWVLEIAIFFLLSRS